MKRFIFITLIVISVLILAADVGVLIYGNYQYDKEINSYWDLSDRASTIPKKSEYLDQFVQALKDSHLAGSYNALVLTRPNNSFDANFTALESLQDRLHEIQKMDITSFAYQTAIQQITAQEQGEAKNMLEVFSGCWWKVHHFWLWNWVGGIQIIFCYVMLAFGIFGSIVAWEDF